eukprot:Protomagalhaensia_sp_Gyna_25__4660@NODE_438_length_3443_cov_24_634841_g338_i0_p1_GENE_NODE_438_length_3443_cov_24_634841_g338_i0NODE_438_length_3443_cov_24_634841_g338_i0_p1_ORF_typecomplete_len582_score88_85Mur_ligase_M/PF08245_12/1_9e22Chorion_2/PF03964_15/0_43Mid2/PF04478_12/12_NODE_438_length_3443_cov_24_634841_g338_i016973412
MEREVDGRRVPRLIPLSWSLGSVGTEGLTTRGLLARRSNSDLASANLIPAPTRKVVSREAEGSSSGGFHTPRPVSEARPQSVPRGPVQRGRLEAILTTIDAKRNRSVVLGLSRMRRFARQARLDLQGKFVFLVGGTNGKGTTVRALESFLLAAGYHVGAYSSPRLLRYEEMVRVDGTEVTENELLHWVLKIEAMAANVNNSSCSSTSTSSSSSSSSTSSSSLSGTKESGGDLALLEPPTVFEHLTLAALSLFQAHSEIEVLVLELGMGADGDAVNWVEPDVSILTNVDLDHVAFLGDTREAIGRRKAHVFRPAKLGLSGDKSGLPASVQTYIDRHSVHCFRLFKEWWFAAEWARNKWSLELTTGTVGSFTPPLGLSDLTIPPHLPLESAALALAALLKSSLRVPPSDVLNRVLLQTRLPGRYQKIWVPGSLTLAPSRRRRPSGAARLFVLDVAHNTPAMQWLAGRLRRDGLRGVDCVFAAQPDKAIESMLEALSDRVAVFFCCPVHPSRRGVTALTTVVKCCAALKLDHRVCSSVATAIERTTAPTVLCCGSFHVVAETLRYFQEELGYAF